MLEAFDLMRGGPVVWVIFAVSLTMWVFILDTYWLLQDVSRKVESGLDHSKVSSECQLLNRRIRTIDNLVHVLPLLGLLGTVNGMIHTFHIIMEFGASNPRGMANGISMALVTTMAGLTTSLSGLYFSHSLSRRVAALTNASTSDQSPKNAISIGPIVSLRDKLQRAGH